MDKQTWDGLLRRVRELGELRERVDDKEKLLLKLAGWRETCETPGSRWMWTKRISITRWYGGQMKTIEYDALMTQKDAVYLQMSLIEEYRLNRRD
jgi:hypothetical protein